MTAATIPLRSLQPSVGSASVHDYDIFSKHGDACCAKLEDDTNPDVFEEDVSKFEVAVSWANGFTSFLNQSQKDVG